MINLDKSQTWIIFLLCLRPFWPRKG